MGRNRFLQPETVRIDIGDGDWILVKKRLNIGEQRKAHAAVIKEVRADGRVTPDLEMLGKAEVIAYLLDWSLCDAHGKPVRVDNEGAKAAAIDNLTQEDFEIISGAIAAHADAMKAARAAEKNATDGESDTSRTSSSVEP
jgi:hypothetical protein